MVRGRLYRDRFMTGKDSHRARFCHSAHCFILRIVNCRHWLLCIFAGFCLVLDAQLPSGAVAFYSFNDRRPSDEITGDSARLVGTRWTKDRFGNSDNAINLLGDVHSYINLGTHPRLRPQAGSIALWVKLDGAVYAGRGYQANPLVLTKSTKSDDFYEAYGLYFDIGVHRFGASCARDSVVQVVIVSLDSVLYNRWYHLVMTYDGDAVALYENGELVNRSPKGFATRFEPTDSVLIGHTNNVKNSRFARGSFDDVYFYDRVLTHDEVQALYSAPDPNRAAIVGMYLLQLFAILVTIALLVLAIRWRLSIVHKREKQKLELQNLQLETELRVNRALMNPHFVFNSLNTLQNFILRNQADHANNYLVKFSKLIRRLLESNLTNRITLGAEVELLKRYLEIEEMRFEDHISSEISVSGSLSLNDICIPVMMIQPFVENAIWHGLLKKSGEKRVDIRFEPSGGRMIRCTIDDNGLGRKPGKPGVSEHQSLATKFIEQRLTLLNRIYKLQCSLAITDKDEGGTRVEIDLPMLEAHKGDAGKKPGQNELRL